MWQKNRTVIDAQLLRGSLWDKQKKRKSEISITAFEMSHRGSVLLARSKELFTIITAAYLGYFLMVGLGFLGHDSFLGWLGAFMLVMSTFASVLFLSVVIKPN